MADVSTYRRCITPYSKAGISFGIGELRSATDPAVTATPGYWATLTDAEMASARWAMVPRP
jgi:hypothetical protein